MPNLTGGCLCGAIRYTVEQAVSDLRMCHCTACQKHTGTAGSVNAIIQSAAFKLVQGTPRRYTMKADSGRTLHRYFCGDCGSPLYSQREVAPEIMVLRAGSIENAPPMKIAAHIWTKSARPWAYIDPAAQTHPGQPDAPAKK